jgi:hydrogenase large subunit
MERLYKVKTLIDELEGFIRNVYLIDLAAVGAMYAHWLPFGKGVTNYLSVPEFPTDTKGTKFMTPGGYIKNGDVSTFKAINSFQDEYFMNGVKESAKHSWYEGEKPLHPYKGETKPYYTDFNEKEKYSWVKSPTFYDEPTQVGPLSNVLAMFAAGHKPTQKYATLALEKISSIAGTKVGIDALHSTLGRHAARCVRTNVLIDVLKDNYNMLVENIATGDMETFNAPTFPKGTQTGFGFHEAPRGVLSHWIVIKDGKIKNYQGVVPSTWNAGPRNQNDKLGPYEASLIGNPIADPEKPLEVLRTIHSFDPCLACAIHVHDNKRKDTIRVKTLSRFPG